MAEHRPGAADGCRLHMTLAGKSFDVVMGVDTHIVMMPTPAGAPIPVPLPNPYVGMLMDPLDWVPLVGATVQIGGLPRATAGSKCLQISPHLPLGGPLAPPATGEAELFMGSSTVAVDGDAQGFTGLPILSCQSVGMPAPLRPKGSPSKSFVLPTSVLLALPLPAPVLIGGAPTISLMGLATNAAFHGLGKLGKMVRKAQGKSGALVRAAAAGMRKVNAAAHALAAPLGLGDVARNRVKRAACTVTGHPVDVATGKVFTDRVDMTLPGPIPFEFERVWYSTSTYRGPLGHGWHHSYDAALYVERDVVLFRAADGRAIAFPPVALGQAYFLAGERLTLLHDSAGYVMRTNDRKLWKFRDIGRSTREHVLVAIEDLIGHTIQLSYDERRRLSEILDSAGRRLLLVHDEADRVCELRTPHPHPTTPDETVVVRRYRYDVQGDLCLVSDALDQRESYEYRAHLLVRETDRNGLSFYFEYDGETASASCLHTWGDRGIYDHRLSYDRERGITTVTNSLGFRTQHEHRNGIVIRSVDAHGGVTVNDYDEADQLLQQQDALGHVTRYSYDARGNVLSVTQPNGAQLQLQYDEHDQPIKAVDALGGHWQYHYDAQGRLLSKQDPLGRTASYRYHHKTLIETVDAAGRATRVQFDTAGNLTYVAQADGSEEHLSYDALGRLLSRSDAAGNVERYEYDVLGRMTRAHDPDGTAHELAYDGEGNVIRAHDHERDLRLTYCGMGRLASRSEDGATVRFEYDSEEQLIGIVNEHGSVYRFELNATGETLVERGFDDRRRDFQRDLMGRVTRLSRANGLVSDYVYDACGRVRRVQHSDGTHEEYSYRLDGELSAASNQSSRVHFVRDITGRLLRELQDGNWVESEYDAGGSRIRMRSSLGADVHIERNAVGDVTGLSHEATQQPKFELRIARDALGLEVERSLPGGVHSRWQRDRMGRPLQHTLQASGQLLRERDYRWHGALRLGSSSDSLFGATRYSHDKRGQLTVAQHARGTELRIPDAVGNLFKREDRSDRKYGPAGQLLYARDEQGRGYDYEYDAEGNLRQKTGDDGQRWQYRWGADGMLHVVIRPDGGLVTFAYDALGRRISKTHRGRVTRWVWDGDVLLHEWTEPEPQPSAAVANSAPSRPSIQAARREAELGPHTLRGPPSASHGSKQKPITWLYEPESFIPCAKLCGDEQLAILTDQVGTPIAMVDSSGQQTWAAEIGGWGQLRALAGNAQDCPIRWPGQYEDEETGLHYNRFRYYDPEAGQYISQDPIGLLGGLKLHGYVADPLTWIDPLGLSCELDEKQRAAAIALAPLKRAFENAKVGFRGSLARGKKGPHKGGAPFDPKNFDVDAFVVSDALAEVVPPNNRGFRNLRKSPTHLAMIRDIDTQLKNIPGVRQDDTFTVRVFSNREFEQKVGPDERYLLQGPMQS